MECDLDAGDLVSALSHVMPNLKQETVDRIGRGMFEHLSHVFMRQERFNELMVAEGARLTEGELAAGWHWCPEMDQLLCIRGGTSCHCSPKD